MPITPELDALVRACFANPKANLPRLVLADYLDEQGENDRATILRIQCELPPPKKKGEKPKIKRGTGKDLREAVTRALAPFAPLRTVLGPFKFVRGFLALAPRRLHHLDRYPHLAELQRLFAEGWVEAVRLGVLHDSAGEQVLSLLRQVGTVEIAHGPSPVGALSAIAAGCRPGLPNCRLQKLKLPSGDRKRFDQLLGTAKEKPPTNPYQDYRNLTPDTAKLIAASGALDGAQTLLLGGNPGEDGFRDIVEHPAIRAVEKLSAFGVRVPPAAWRRLWAVESAALAQLVVGDAGLGDDGIRALCAGSFLPTASLYLRQVGMTSASVPALMGCHRLASVTHLDFHGNELSADAVADLICSPTFASVRQLHVGECGIAGPQLLPALFAAPHRPEFVLSATLLRATLLRPSGSAPRLALNSASYNARNFPWPAAPCPEPLAALDLTALQFDAERIGHLTAWLGGRTVPSLSMFRCLRRAADWPRWLPFVEAARPRELTLRGMELGPRACQQFAASPALATVEKLRLENNPIRLTGALAIANSPHRGNLKEFVARGCGLTRAEQTRVRAAFDGVAVTS